MTARTAQRSIAGTPRGRLQLVLFRHSATTKRSDVSDNLLGERPVINPGFVAQVKSIFKMG
jgi:hypothetical protein